MKKNERKSSNANFIHNNITCDGCKKGIKNMARFKSLLINDYDLCEECEKTGIHSGPMVKFSTPSSYNAYQLNNKFKDFTPFFKGETETKEQNGFFMHPECPLRRGPIRRCGRNNQDRPNHPQQQRGPFQNCRGPIDQNILKGFTEGFKPFGGFINNIVQNIKTELTKHSKPEANMTENKPQVDDTFLKIAEDFVAEFPEMGFDINVIANIASENKLFSKDAIMNYIYQ